MEDIMDKIDETFLIKSSQKGDIDAFERLIECHKQRAYAIALKVTKNREDALDASQDALIKIYKSIGKFSFKSSFSTWVYKIVVNCCLDHINKQKRLVPVDNDRLNIKKEEIVGGFEDRSSPEAVLEKKIKKDEVEKALCELDEEFRVAVILRDIEGFSYDEIARISGVSIGTVKSRISRGRRKLRDIIVKRRSGGDAHEM